VKRYTHNRIHSSDSPQETLI